VTDLPLGKKKMIELRDDLQKQLDNTFDQIDKMCKDGINALTTIKRESYFEKRTTKYGFELLARTQGDLIIAQQRITGYLGALAAYKESLNAINELLGEGSISGSQEEGKEGAQSTKGSRSKHSQHEELNSAKGTSLDAPEAEEDKHEPAKRNSRSRSAQKGDQAATSSSRAGTRCNQGKSSRSSKGSSSTRKRGAR
jgi:hypothetical protein